MSDEKQETIADIVREMRKRAEEVYAGQAGYPESWKDQMNDDEIREIADRIEAADHRFREITKMIPHEEAAAAEMETTCMIMIAVHSHGRRCRMRLAGKKNCRSRTAQ